MQAPAVLFVDDVQVRTAMDAADARMRALGCDVVRYASMQALAADAAMLERASVLVVSTNTPCPRAILERASHLRAVIFPASGTETMDFSAAAGCGILVGHGAFPENAESMAESTIMLMLVLMYDLHRSESLLRDAMPRPQQLYARMLKNRTVGLIGYGRIGHAIAHRLQAWQTHVLACSPHSAGDGLAPHVQAAALDDLLRQSDIVCVVCALNAQTRGMLDATRLGLMKPSAVLVNTARGAVCDEKALFAALRDRRIAGAALDTFTTEPLPQDSPLRGLDNVVLTPHIVGHTLDAIERAHRVLIEGIENVLRGLPPPYVRNPEVLPAWRARWEKVPRLI